MIVDKTGDYSSIQKSFKTLCVQDGFGELYKGGTINIARGIFLSTMDLAIYHQVREWMLGENQGQYKWQVYFASSLISGFISAVLSYPVDILRTIYLNEKSRGVKSNRTYKHMGALFMGIYAREGVKGYFRGFNAYLSRFLMYGPLFWNTYEFLKYNLKGNEKF